MRRVDNAILKKFATYGVAVLLFMLSYYGNVFGLGPSQGWFQDFQQKDSAAIVRKTAQCKNEKLYDGPLAWVDYGKFTSTESCASNVIRPYESQYGAQSRLISFFAPGGSSESLDRYFKAIELLLVLSLSVGLLMFVRKVAQLFGMRVALVVFGLLLFSPWLAAYAKNMYWVTILIFMPFLFSFLTYEWFKGAKKLYVFYLALLALFYLRLLNGYEHVSTIMVSALVPVVFIELRDRTINLKDLLRPAITIFVAGVLALALAMLTNIASLAEYYHSWDKASELVLNRAEDRASSIKKMQPYVIGGLQATLPDVYGFVDRFYDLDQLVSGNGHPLKYLALSVMNYSLLPAVSLPVLLREPIGTMVQSIVVIGIIGYICILAISRKSKFRQYSRSFYWSYWLSLGGALSWLVLMPAHAYPHAHLNAIIFYLPFLLICYMAIGVWISAIKFGKR